MESKLIKNSAEDIGKYSLMDLSFLGGLKFAYDNCTAFLKFLKDYDDVLQDMMNIE